MVSRAEYDCSHRSRDLVERHRVAVAEDGREDLDREEHDRDVRCRAAGQSISQSIGSMRGARTDDPGDEEEGDEARGEDRDESVDGEAPARRVLVRSPLLL